MQKIVENLYLLNEGSGANVYLVQGPSGPALIDCGMSKNTEWITGQLAEINLDPTQLKELILTHSHSDHCGGAESLRNTVAIPISASRIESPYLKKKTRLPYQSLVQRLIFWISDLAAGIPPLPVDRTLEEGDRLDYLGGLEVLHTPGHTPGSISLLQREAGILICGDAVFNQHPVTGAVGLRQPLKLATVDPDLAKGSIQEIAALDLELLCPGHGPPLEGNIPELLTKLLT
jgi:glyoxylase-like metal-dependent hydrolase (beta-lactamase superfamily II)